MKRVLFIFDRECGRKSQKKLYGCIEGAAERECEMKTQIPEIGTKEKFYGYIVGLSIEPMNEAGKWCHRMYAVFQYNKRPKKYEVPDSKLFKKLSKHLIEMTLQRDVSDDFGYEKLWIQKEGGKWIVFLP